MFKALRKKENRKFVIFIIISFILSLVLMGVIVYQTYNHNTSKSNNQNSDKHEQDNNKDGNNQDKNTPAKIMYILKDEKGYILTVAESTYNNEAWYQKNTTKVNEYECVDSSCELLANMYLLATMKDGENFVVYDYPTNKFTTIKLGSYDLANIINDNGKMYGIDVNRNEKHGFYSIDLNKYITDFKYDDISGDEGVSKGYVYARNCNEDKMCSAYVLNSTTGEVVKTAGPTDSMIDWQCVIKNNKTFYLALYDIDFASVSFYDENFNQLLNGEKFFTYEITDAAHIVVVNSSDKTFSEYNSNGSLLYTSKEYTTVGVLDKGYAGVIDTDNYLKLVDYRDNIIASFVKWSNDYKFHSMISGYFEIEGKPRGVYLVVENNSTDDMTPGHCKEYYYDMDKKTTGFDEEDTCNGYAKPILYLYPEKETNITVSFEKPYLLTTTYPKYKNKWQVTAYSNGDLYDNNGKYYYALYWEEQGSSNIDFHEGFYVTSDNAINFLEEKLIKIGLTDREANEFIMYWLPILEKNGKSLVYFELTDERQSYNELRINPKPDSLLRLAIHIKKVDSYVKIKEQKLTTFKRLGFTAIEWGGVIH